ncbi:hypothetical protein Peur_049158 [Populus x canadensis]
MQLNSFSYNAQDDSCISLLENSLAINDYVHVHNNCFNLEFLFVCSSTRYGRSVPINNSKWPWFRYHDSQKLTNKLEIDDEYQSSKIVPLLSFF